MITKKGITKNSILVLQFLFLCLVLVSCKDDDDDDKKTYEEIVAVANRASSNISFIDSKTNEVLTTLEIANSQPMYVVYVPSKDKLYVGDVTNKKVHIINPETRSVESSIDVGEGVFHMWADGQGNQLWVNNATDQTTSVIDLNTNEVVQTIDLGITPHDVFLTNDATKAYISVLTPEDTVADSIYMYSPTTYEKIGSKAVGEDPHLYHLSNSNKLFVPCQSGDLFTLDGDNLNEISHMSLVGAHGIFSTPDLSNLILANISGGQLYSVNPSDSTLNGDAIDSLDSTPHNIVINEEGNKVFVTHSGASANTLTTYGLSNGTITSEASITIGTNPFGLAYYKREVN